MKLLKTLALVSAASLFFSSCIIRQYPASKRTVSVSGSGSVTVEADNATIVLSVITRSKDLASAAGDNAKKMTAVQDAIIALGFQKSAITTQNYSIYQESSYSNGKQVLGDYRVTNEVKVTVNELDKVSEIIDTAIKAGANQLSSLDFGMTDTQLAVKQARTLAIQQAQDAALLIAGTSGAELGKVLTIQERQSSALPRTVMLKAAAYNDAAMEAASTPISSGKSTITITVDATYELK